MDLPSVSGVNMQFFSKDNLPPASPFSEPGIKASIDIGTNTILLLVADTDGDRVHVLHEIQRLPRIGRGVDASGAISMESMERAISVLIEFRDFIYAQWGVIPVMVTATSAVRDASNRVEFMWLVEEATGYRIRLLSGQEEAQCTYKGAMSQLDALAEAALVVDIGGGSTELAFGNVRDGIVESVSLDAGSVRFTERFLGGGPVGESNMLACREFLQGQLQSVKWLDPIRWDSAAISLIGVAGTATTLAAIVHRIEVYTPAAMNGLTMSVTDIAEFTASIRDKSPEEIEQIHPEFMQGRQDIILAGSLILEEIMRYVGSNKIRVSTGGIRHGALIEKLYG